MMLEELIIMIFEGWFGWFNLFLNDSFFCHRNAKTLVPCLNLKEQKRRFMRILGDSQCDTSRQMLHLWMVHVWIWDSLGRHKIPRFVTFPFWDSLGWSKFRGAWHRPRCELISWFRGSTWVVEDAFQDITDFVIGFNENFGNISDVNMFEHVLPFWYCFRLNLRVVAANANDHQIELLMSLQNSFRAHLNRFQLFGVSGNQTWLENLPKMMIFTAFWASTSWIFMDFPACYVC